MTKVIYLPKVISTTDSIETEFAPDLSVAEILTGTKEPVGEEYDYLVEVEGVYVPRENWHRVKPKEGTNVLIRPVLRGDSKTLMPILIGLAIVAAALVLGPIVGGALFGTLFSASVASALGTALIGGAGALLLQSLAPPASPDGLTNAAGLELNTSPTLRITGAQNQVQPWGVVPLVLGRNKVTPPLGAKTYTEIRGLTKQFFRMLVVWGYGRLDIDNDQIKIGNTKLNEYQNFRLQTREGQVGDSPLTLFPDVVDEQALSILLRHSDGYITRTTAPNCDEFSLDLVFANGLLEFDPETGKKSKLTVRLDVRYKKVGDPGWTDLPQIVVTEKRDEAFGRNVRVEDLVRGTYQVAVKRTTADAATNDDNTIDKVYWTAFRTFTNEDPIQFPHPLAKTALMIQATEQLNGVINNLNCIVQSYAPVWNGSTWSDAPTSNPASLFRLVLQGNAISRPVPDEEIDIDQMEYWSEFCDLKGLEFNAVIDTETQLWDVLQMIAAAGLASVQIKDGKWSVVIDEPKANVVALFTPHNSSKFSCDLPYVDIPHALRIKFINEQSNHYRADEIIIYREGYNASNATNYESWDCPGVTNPDQITRMGYRWMANLLLRPMTYNWETGITNLIVTRGDRIKRIDDTVEFGLSSGRIKSVVGDDGSPTEMLVSVTVDNACPMAAAGSYAIRVQKSDGTFIVMPVVTNAGQQYSLVIDDSIELADGPEAGDMFAFGEEGRESVDLIVLGVVPTDDLNARILAVDYSPELYDVDSAEIPEFNTNITLPPDTGKQPTAPVISSVQSDISVAIVANDGSVQERVLIVVSPPSNFDPSEVLVEGQARLDGTDDWADIQTQSKNDRVYISGVTGGDIYDLRVRFKTTAASRVPGAVSFWTELSDYTVIGKTDLPPDITELKLEGTRAVWTIYQSPLDLAGFEMRVNRGTAVSWDDAIPVQDNLILTTEFDLSWLTGGVFTVLVKAVDDGGRYSENATGMVINLGDTAFGNIYKNVNMEAIDFGIGTDIATVTGGSVVSGDLEADTASGFWNGADADEFWQSGDSLFWQDNAVEMTYDFTYTPEIGEIGSELGMVYTLQASEYFVMYHTDGDNLFFTGNNDELSFTGDDEAEGLAAWGAWRVWPGKISIRDREKYFFRFVTGAGTIQGIIFTLVLNIDVPDLVEELFNVSISNVGTRLPITTTFDAIKGVILTVRGGGSGRFATTQDLDLSGPMIYVYDGSNVQVAGNVDARVVGYNV